MESLDVKNEKALCRHALSKPCPRSISAPKYKQCECVCVLREKEAEDCIQGSSDVLLPSTGERSEYVCGVYMAGLEVRVGAWEDGGRESVKAERLKLLCLRLEVKLPYDLLPADDQAPA